MNQLKLRFDTVSMAEIKEELLSNKEYTRLAKHIKGEYWADLMSDAELLQLGAALSEMENRYDIDAFLEFKSTAEQTKVQTEELVREINYQYDDLRKKTYLFMYGAKWSTPRTLLKAIDAFRYIEYTEVQLEKSLLGFDVREIQQSILNLYQEQGLTLAVVTHTVNFLFRYSSDFGAKYEDDWYENKSFAAINNLVKSDQNISDSCIEKIVIDYFMDNENPQFSIIPILQFEGVNLSTKDEEDEMRYIRIEDIYENGIMLKSGEKREKSRFLVLNKDIISMVRKAASQKIYIGRSGRVLRPPFRETGYLIKPIDSPDSSPVMSYAGVARRYREFQRIIERDYGVDKFPSKTLVNYGKVRNVNKLMDNGEDWYNAVVQTLQRFGEYEFYNSDIESERKTIDESNTTRIYRLKRLLGAYGGNNQEE